MDACIKPKSSKISQNTTIREKKTQYFLICRSNLLDFLYFIKNIQIQFHLGDLANCMGDWEIRFVSGRLPDYLEELALIINDIWLWLFQVSLT